MSDRAAVLSFDRHASAEEMAGGLAWVRWLLGSVRARCEHLHFHPPSLSGPDVYSRWTSFNANRFQRFAAGRLAEAWQAADGRDVDAVIAVDAGLSDWMEEIEISRSRKAGEILLRTTKGARYQGLLGRYRAEVEAGNAPGHFLVVWAAVGQFFQLSLVNVLAEYLRLEWELGTRDLAPAQPPAGSGSLTSMVGAAINGRGAQPSPVRREG